MTYNQFVTEIEKRVRDCVSGNASVRVHTAVKNNGCERKGIMFSEKGVNISPAIYLEEFYDSFCEGKKTEEIVEQIMELYKEVRFRKSWEAEDIQVFERVKPRLACRVVNRKTNQQILGEVPHREVMDLVLVCYVLLELNQYQTATMLVRNEHLKLWGVTEEEVFREAEKNIKRLLPAEFSRMKDVLAHLLDIRIDDGEEDDCMYVLSNEARSFGAVCIFYEGVAEMIRNRLGENYYVIPSSIHEVIILPESKAPGRKEIEEMIAEVNETQVEDEEVLSGRVYYYNALEKRLTM